MRPAIVEALAGPRRVGNVGNRGRSVEQILEAFDRWCASPVREEDSIDLFMRDVLGIDGVEDQRRFVGWRDGDARALLAAFASCAPSDDLRAMQRRAKKQQQWIEWWDREGWAQAHGCVPLPWGAS